MIVNVIHCGLPKGKATTSTTNEYGVYIVYVNRDLTGNELRTELSHELRHVINDDFNKNHHVNLIEHMVRNTTFNNDFEGVDFYHHYLNKDDDIF